MIPIQERLRKRLRVMPSGCWEFEGCRLKEGYGKIGKGRKEEGTIRTHRVMWEIVHGPIPEGLCVLHSCDNPPCANPRHLFLGTRSDNAADRDAKGRGNKGERNGRAKLTLAQVQEIRADSRVYREIAAEYGVSRGLISGIRRGHTWRV